jgi:hypothetical protein
MIKVMAIMTMKITIIITIIIIIIIKIIITGNDKADLNSYFNYHKKPKYKFINLKNLIFIISP